MARHDEIIKQLDEIVKNETLEGRDKLLKELDSLKWFYEAECYICGDKEVDINAIMDNGELANYHLYFLNDKPIYICSGFRCGDKDVGQLTKMFGENPRRKKANKSFEDTMSPPLWYTEEKRKTGWFSSEEVKVIAKPLAEELTNNLDGFREKIANIEQDRKKEAKEGDKRYIALRKKVSKRWNDLFTTLFTKADAKLTFNDAFNYFEAMDIDGDIDSLSEEFWHFDGLGNYHSKKVFGNIPNSDDITKVYPLMIDPLIVQGWNQDFHEKWPDDVYEGSTYFYQGYGGKTTFSWNVDENRRDFFKANLEYHVFNLDSKLKKTGNSRYYLKK